jgi:putative zinc finger protein
MTHPQELLARSLDQDLSYLQRIALREHLAACTDCAALATDLRRGEELLSHAEARPPVPSFDAADRSAGWGWLSAAGAMATAFVLLTAVVVGFGSERAGVGAAPVATTGSPTAAFATPAVSSPPSSTARECARPALGDITLCPAVVSVGARLSITLPSRSCGGDNSGSTTLYFGTAEQFGQSTTATYGETELGGFGPSSGISEVTLAVPDQLAALDGRGGGYLRPGLYAVYAKIAACRTFVTVR